MRKRNIFGIFLWIALAAVAFQGCNKDKDNQEAKDQEMRLLQQYLNDNNITREPTASGLIYIQLEEGSGRRVQDLDIVDMGYTAVLIDGTVLYTSHQDIAEDNDLYDATKIYGPIRLQAGNTSIPGLDEGLQMMREGGRATMIMPSYINGFGATSIGPSGPYSTHIYTIELVDAFNDPVAFQDSMINAYITQQEHDSIYVITKTGLYYSQIEPGVGDLIASGDHVSLWYTGTFLDGRVFDSNTDGTVMQLIMPASGYIPAWDEALRLMKAGTVAKIIVPYQLGYGAYAQGQIPPYATLVFDIEIDSVE